MPGALAVKQNIALTGLSANHLQKVLRLRIADPVEIFNGEGGAYRGKIVSIDKKQVGIELLSFNQQNQQSPLSIHLGQAISRGDKMDFTIQKAVELGVSVITPLFTEKCGVKLSTERQQKRIRHWQAVILSACEQCGRNLIPELRSPQQLTTWLQDISSMPGIVLTPHQGQTWQELTGEYEQLALLVGSESGLTTEEVNLARQHGMLALSLGPRILRTETAALSAITALQLKWGDLG